MTKLNVLFWIRKNKLNQNTEAPIYCRITYSKKRASDFSTGIFTDPECWNSKSQKINDEIKQNELDLIKQKLFAIKLDLELKGAAEISADLIKALYHGQASAESLTFSVKLPDLCEEVKKQNPHCKKYLPIILMFLECHIKNEPINKIESVGNIAEDFKNWLLSKYSQNYSNKILTAARALFSYAEKKKYVKINPFSFVKIKRKRKPLIVLEKDELEKLWKYKFASQRLQQTADLFLLQCYTGMAYCELMGFDKEKHLHNDFIDIQRQKTDCASVIPTLERAIKIFKKYNYQPPRISNAKYNSYLKEVADIVGINKNLTTHVGRKTCGYILLNEGVSIEVVSRILGHDTIKTTQQIYAVVNKHRIRREVNSIKKNLK